MARQFLPLVLLIVLLVPAAARSGPAPPAQQSPTAQSERVRQGVSHFERAFYELTPQKRDREAAQEFEQAIAQFELELSRQPSSPVAHGYLGRVPNPYAYTVPASSTNPIRALVFDAGTISQVNYRIDGGTTWLPMTRVAANPALWEATFDASALAAGDHAVEARTVGTTTMSDAITMNVTGTVNRPPVAVSDSYGIEGGKTLSVAAPGVLSNDTDADGNTLKAQLATGPAHAQSFTLNENAAFMFTPAADYSGPDSFTYTAGDGLATSAAAAVTITVMPPPQGDTITITSATWASKTKRLTVQATSSAQPNAVLTVVGYGTMTYKAKTKNYVLQAPAPIEPATVTITSNVGGTATASVK